MPHNGGNCSKSKKKGNPRDARAKLKYKKAEMTLTDVTFLFLFQIFCFEVTFLCLPRLGLLFFSKKESYVMKLIKETINKVQQLNYLNKNCKKILRAVNLKLLIWILVRRMFLL